MSSSISDVLICGAGPAGLVTALSLAKNGIPVRVIDKSLEYQKGTRGPSLAPRSVELLDLLGVLPEILKTAGDFPPRVEYQDGKIVKKWDIMEHQAVTPAFPHPNAVLSPQAATGAVLRAHLAEHYNVNVELGVEVVNFTQDDECVTAELLKTTSDGKQESENAKFKYLVGMDGGRGVTRKLLGIPFAGDTLSQEIVVCDAVLKGLDRDHWHTFGTMPASVFNALPVGDADSQMFNIVLGGKSIDCPGVVDKGRDGLAAAIDDICVGLEPKVEVVDVKWISLFKPSFRCAQSFGVGRVFIGGDNAHIHSPMGGQGLNSSVQDAHNLGWKLALVLKGLSPPSLLESYSEERIPVIKAMLGLTQGIHLATSGPDVKVTSDDGTRHTQGGLIDRPALATAKTPAAEATAPAPTNASSPGIHGPGAGARGGRGGGGGHGGGGCPRTQLLTMLGVNYRWSNIVFDARDASRAAENGPGARQTAYGFEGVKWGEVPVRAGDRALDAPVRHSKEGTSTSLHKLFDPAKHTVLVFPPSSTPLDATSLGETLRSVQQAISPRTSVIDTLLVLPATSSKDEVEVSGIQTVVDVDGHAARAYEVAKSVPAGSGKPLIVIIRPDEVVGAYVFDVEGVQEYLKAVFV
ncbi:hypothetical protein DL93DRAFT_1424691 [Clavulina sp. PMI_390]|nr:hypothetical protein DL93DRAFT_1424691 [Clavulina sp. PMI_390]